MKRATKSELLTKSTNLIRPRGKDEIILLTSISIPAKKIRNRKPVCAKKLVMAVSSTQSNTKGPTITPITISTITEGTFEISNLESTKGTTQAIDRMIKIGQYSRLFIKVVKVRNFPKIGKNELSHDYKLQRMPEPKIFKALKSRNRKLKK